MDLNYILSISFASHYIFKMAAVTGCYETSFINSILNYQTILIKFALKLFVSKCLSFQIYLLIDLHFPLTSAEGTKFPLFSLIDLWCDLS